MKCISRYIFVLYRKAVLTFAGLFELIPYHCKNQEQKKLFQVLLFRFLFLQCQSESLNSKMSFSIESRDNLYSSNSSIFSSPLLLVCTAAFFILFTAAAWTRIVSADFFTFYNRFFSLRFTVAQIFGSRFCNRFTFNLSI